MRLKSVGLLTASLISALALSCASAKADTFTFSFSEDPTYGNIGGVVTGEIGGLTNNSTTPASQVLIETFPSDFSPIIGVGPLDATTWANQSANSFTEVNGQIVAGSFYAYIQPPDPSGLSIYLYLNFGSTGTNNLTAVYYDDGYGPVVLANDQGLQGLNLVQVSSTVPEPSIMSSLFASFLSLGLVMGIRRSRGGNLARGG